MSILYRIEYQYRPGARWRAFHWTLPPLDPMVVESRRSAEMFADERATLGRYNPNTPGFRTRVVTVRQP